jgi:transposase
VPLVEKCATFRSIVMTLFCRYNSPTRNRLTARKETTKKPNRKPTNRGDLREDPPAYPERIAIPGQNYKAKYGGRIAGTDFINPLKSELNPICHLLVLLGTHHILHVSRIRVNLVTRHEF